PRIIRLDHPEPVRLFDDAVISEEVGRLGTQHLEHLERELADLGLGRGGAAHLEEVAPRAGVPGDDDLGLGRVGEGAARGLARSQLFFQISNAGVPSSISGGRTKATSDSSTYRWLSCE